MHCFNATLIGTYTRPSQGCHLSDLEWSWVTYDTKHRAVSRRQLSFLLAERYYATFGWLHEPSVCRLWRSCALLKSVKLLSNTFFHNLIAQALGEFVLTFWTKIWRGSRAPCKINTHGRSSINISLYFENGTTYGHSYNSRLIESRIWFIEWRHFQWPWMILNPD